MILYKLYMPYPFHNPPILSQFFIRFLITVYTVSSSLQKQTRPTESLRLAGSALFYALYLIRILFKFA